MNQTVQNIQDNQVADFEDLLNSSLETKFGIYENMANYVGDRPVIFTSRPEIWSTDTNPVIIVGHPFPSESPSNNSKPNDLTRDMIDSYQQFIQIEEKEGQYINLILFQFQVHGSREVHAIFCRGENNAENDVPLEIYLKHLDHTEVLIRQCSTKSNSAKSSRTSVPMVLASEISLVRPATISGAVRTVHVSMKNDAASDISPIQSRLGQEMCFNLEEKVEHFQVVLSSGKDTKGIMFTDVLGLWNPKITCVMINNPMPRIPADYDHERFDIEGDILEYIKHVAKKRTMPSFYAHSRKFGDGQIADVHLMFTLPREYKYTKKYLRTLKNDPEERTL